MVSFPFLCDYEIDTFEFELAFIQLQFQRTESVSRHIDIISGIFLTNVSFSP